MPPLDPPPAPLAPGGNASPTAPVAPLPAGQSASPTAPPAPLAAGQAASPSAPPAPLPKGGSVDGIDQIVVTGTLTEDGTTTIETPITLLYAGEFGGKPSYTSTGESPNDIATDPNGEYVLYYTPAILGAWFFSSAIPDQQNYWGSGDDTDLPQDATGWTAIGTATGTPTFTLSRGGPASPPQPFPAGQSSTPSAPPAPLGAGQSVSPSAPPAPLDAGAGVNPSAPPAPLAPGRVETPPSPPQPV